MNHFTVTWQLRVGKETERYMTFSFKEDGVGEVVEALSDMLAGCGFQPVSIGRAMRDVGEQLLRDFGGSDADCADVED